MEVLTSNLTITETETSDLEKLLTFILLLVQQYVALIIIVTGLIGNTLSYMAMNQPHNRNSVMCFYFKSLAITDTLSLITCLMPRFLFAHRTDLMESQTIATAGCIVFYLLGYIFYNSTIWVVLIIAVDRYIAVRFPLKVASMCTMKRAKRRVAANLIFHVVVYFPNVFRVAARDADGRYSECVLPDVLHWYYTGHEVINAVADVIITLAAIFYLNGAIIFSLKSSSSEIQNAVSEKSKSREKQEKSMTRMLVVVATTLLCLLMPYTTEFVIWACCLQDIAAANPAARGLSFEIGLQLCIVSNAINFFLYLSSSSKFRADLRMLFACKPGEPKN